jgi:hypothetical protein
VTPGFFTQVPFAEGWDGSTWSKEPSATPSQALGPLDGVSCPSSTACTAVGGQLAERWDGSSWATQTVPTPPTGKGPVLLSVSCPSKSGCVAVGGYIANGYKAYYKPIAELWTQ